MLKFPFLIIIVLLLCSCGQLVQVKDTPEVMVKEELTTTVTTQPDGNRIVTIQGGETVYAIIALPPIKKIEVEKK
jgi:ABC-type Fe3+-hydroxamate transport system substrate-binding protein